MYILEYGKSKVPPLSREPVSDHVAVFQSWTNHVTFWTFFRTTS